MNELTALLSRERLLLELMLFKLVELRQLLAAGEGRFLAWAAAEVERATRKVREVELCRSMVVDRLGTEHGLPADERTLGRLAEFAEPPYRGMLEEDRRALLAILVEVERALEIAGMRAPEETAVPDDLAAVLDLSLARAGGRAALTAVTRAYLPSLTEFLGTRSHA